MKAIAPLLLAIVLLPTAPMVSADVLLMDTIRQAHDPSTTTAPHPTRGMSMAQVRQQFGEPQTEYPWVGEPPITRWEYDGFTVYFEYELVIETVIHRK